MTVWNLDGRRRTALSKRESTSRNLSGSLELNKINLRIYFHEPFIFADCHQWPTRFSQPWTNFAPFQRFYWRCIGGIFFIFILIFANLLGRCECASVGPRVAPSQLPQMCETVERTALSDRGSEAVHCEFRSLIKNTDRRPPNPKWKNNLSRPFAGPNLLPIDAISICPTQSPPQKPLPSSFCLYSIFLFLWTFINS